MSAQDIISSLRELAAFTVGNAKTALLIVCVILCLTYLVIVAVALFHPDEHRRAEARSMLKYHKLARKR